MRDKETLKVKVRHEHAHLLKSDRATLSARDCGHLYSPLLRKGTC
jgi:hypothetical protein